MKTKEKPRRVLCVACGDELQEFAFSRDAADVKAIVKRYAACRDSRKFNGKFCARLFIAGGDSVPRSRTTPRVSAARVGRVKRAVVARIAREEATPRAASRPRNKKTTRR